MFFDLKVEEQAAQAAMSIRLRTSVKKLPQLIGESYRKIAAYLAEAGVQPQFAPEVSSIALQPINPHFYPLRMLLVAHTRVFILKKNFTG